MCVAASRVEIKKKVSILSRYIFTSDYARPVPTWRRGPLARMVPDWRLFAILLTFRHFGDLGDFLAIFLSILIVGQLVISPYSNIF